MSAPRTNTLPLATRTAARELARRVSEAGRPEYATTMRSADRTWTLARAATVAADSLVLISSGATLRADLRAFAAEVVRVGAGTGIAPRNVFAVTVSL